MNKVIEKLEQLYLDYSKIGMYSKVHTINRCIDIIESTDSWISVDERLPDENCKILTIDTKGDIFTRNFYLDIGIPSINKVTHWQPLPKPPKQK